MSVFCLGPLHSLTRPYLFNFDLCLSFCFCSLQLRDTRPLPEIPGDTMHRSCNQFDQSEYKTFEVFRKFQVLLCKFYFIKWIWGGGGRHPISQCFLKTSVVHILLVYQQWRLLYKNKLRAERTARTRLHKIINIPSLFSFYRRFCRTKIHVSKRQAVPSKSAEDLKFKFERGRNFKNFVLVKTWKLGTPLDHCFFRKEDFSQIFFLNVSKIYLKFLNFPKSLLNTSSIFKKNCPQFEKFLKFIQILSPFTKMSSNNRKFPQLKLDILQHT